MMEEDRFKGIESNVRICPPCLMNITGDEYHFHLVCPTYRETREKMNLSKI